MRSPAFCAAPLPPDLARHERVQFIGADARHWFPSGRRSLAWHEAGHCVLALWSRCPVANVRLGRKLGRLTVDMPAPQPGAVPPLGPAEAIESAALYLAGVQAEATYNGLWVPPGVLLADCLADFRNAARYLADGGLGCLDDWLAAQDLARAVLDANAAALEAIAVRLFDCGRVEGAELETIWFDCSASAPSEARHRGACDAQ
jgi:hypothetical protein